MINKKSFHSIVSLTNDTIVMEFEINPNKCDLYRYKDSYNRQNDGYEGVTDMIKNEYNDLTNYFDFYGDYDFLVKEFDNVILSFNNNKINNIDINSIYVIFNGIIKHHTYYISPGSILLGKDLALMHQLEYTSDFSYVQIKQK